jgi:preprotein translocase subunit SecD
LAIVLDAKVLSVPIIQAEISTQAVIAGNFTKQDTRRLAVQLGSGALPFEMQMTSIQSATGIAVSTATPTTSS